MRIIAKDSSGYGSTYIVEMTERELNTLAGIDRCNSFRAGAEVKVLDRFYHLENIESAQSRLDRAAKDLHALADMLARVDVVVPPRQEPETKETK